MASFLGEIKRRKVFQVAAVYAVVSWLLIQIVATIEEPLGLPSWFDTSVIVLLAVGFPIALILSWAFALTPESLTSTSDARPAKGVAHAGGHGLTYLSHGLILLAVGFLIADEYLLGPRAGPGSMSVVTSTVGSQLVNRFDHDIPADQTFRFPGFNVLAFSRDGRSIVYNTTDGLYLRSMDEREARLIPGTEETMAGIEFSPDGQSIIFVTPGDELNRMSISGGAPVAYEEAAPAGAVLSYESDEWILYRGGGIFRISPDGGSPELIVPHTEGESIVSQRLLPDGDTVLFSATRTGSVNDAQVLVQSISTGERTMLVSRGADARYVPSGHLIYALQDGLYAVAFDLDSLTASGVPVQVVQGVLRSSAPSGSANYGVSEDGTLVYITGLSAIEVRRLLWVDREGNEETIEAPPRPYTSPRLSPDDTMLAISAYDHGDDIYIWDLDGAAPPRRLTFDPGRDRWPLWYPDSRRLAYSAGLGNVSQAVDGTGPVEPLAGSDGDGVRGWPASFLPDATGILVYGERGEPNDDIALVPLDGAGEITVLLNSSANEKLPEVSPGGEWLAYVSDESGNEEVYVRPFPDVRAGGQWEISRGPGTEPLWAPNGEELFFRRDGAVWAVPIQTDPVFSPGNPEVVLEGPYLQGILGGRSYDISRDGDRFLMLSAFTDESTAPKIVIVQNWVEELKRLVPTE